MYAHSKLFTHIVFSSSLYLDINECQQVPKPCAYQCQNLAGSYKCLCPPGKQLLGDGRSCAGLERLGTNSTLGTTSAQFQQPFTNGRIHGNNVYTWLSFSQNGNLIGQNSPARCPPGFMRRHGVCTGKQENAGCNHTETEFGNCTGSYVFVPKVFLISHILYLVWKLMGSVSLWPKVWSVRVAFLWVQTCMPLATEKCEEFWKKNCPQASGTSDGKKDLLYFLCSRWFRTSGDIYLKLYKVLNHLNISMYGL